MPGYDPLTFANWSGDIAGGPSFGSNSVPSSYISSGSVVTNTSADVPVVPEISSEVSSALTPSNEVDFDRFDPRDWNWLQRTFDPAGYGVAANLYNSAMDRDFNAKEAELARSFSAAEAQKNRDFQKLLSNTSYQRAVADLKAAGLNPALLYSSAGSASTPSGSVASSPAAYHSSSVNTNTSGNGSVISTLVRTALDFAGDIASALARISIFG